ncbi:hypothetical protein [Stappia stellulata]|uniref:hypothetical protein n=1 Tax=Stappia stellulata TaxID=71235 RepID=UPI0012EC2FE4|nr:hypothetical protein [Stappia stellulata]
MKASLIAFSVFLAFAPLSSHAGRLGKCVKCASDAGPQIDTWDMGNPLGGCGLMATGGDGDPRLCDANMGIVRGGPMNDPFWQCSTGSSSFTTWIGGEDKDLIIVGEDKSNISSGTFYRIQDGDEYDCGVDVFTGKNHTVVRYGRDNDIFDIFTKKPDGFSRNTYRIEDGDGHGLVSGDNVVGRLYGNHKDIIALYGISDDGTVSEWRRGFFDGRFHGMELLGPSDVGLIYGNDNDIRVRFCFDGKSWTFGPHIGFGQPYPAACSQPLP